MTRQEKNKVRRDLIQWARTQDNPVAKAYNEAFPGALAPRIVFTKLFPVINSSIEGYVAFENADSIKRWTKEGAQFKKEGGKLIFVGVDNAKQDSYIAKINEIRKAKGKAPKQPTMFVQKVGI